METTFFGGKITQQCEQALQSVEVTEVKQITSLLPTSLSHQVHALFNDKITVLQQAELKMFKQQTQYLPQSELFEHDVLVHHLGLRLNLAITVLQTQEDGSIVKHPVLGNHNGIPLTLKHDRKNYILSMLQVEFVMKDNTPQEQLYKACLIAKSIRDGVSISNSQIDDIMSNTKRQLEKNAPYIKDAEVISEIHDKMRLGKIEPIIEELKTGQYVNDLQTLEILQPLLSASNVKEYLQALRLSSEIEHPLEEEAKSISPYTKEYAKEIFLNNVPGAYIAYMKEMSPNPLFGGDIELKHLCALLKIKATVLKPEEHNIFKEITTIGDSENTHTVKLILNNRHYDVMHPNTGEKFPIPKDGHCMFAACLVAKQLAENSETTPTLPSLEEISKLRTEVAEALNNDNDRESIKLLFSAVLHAKTQ